MGLALLGGSVLVSPITHAASRPATPSVVARLVTASHVFVGHRLSVRMNDVRETTTRRPSRQDASLLAPPATAFSPATAVQQYTGLEKPADADQNSFSIFHGASYTKLGLVSAFYERADWKPAGAADTAIFRYQAGVFGSAAAAKGAWQDGVTHTQTLSGVAPTDCTSQLQASCSYGGFQTTNNTQVLYFTVVYNQCLVETATEFTPALYTSQQSQLASTTGAIVAAGLAAAQSACGTSPGPNPSVTPTSTVNFSLVGLAVHKKQKVADPQKASVKTVKVGKTVYLYIYYAVQSAPATAKVAATFTLTRNGAQVATRSFPHGLLAAAPNAFYEDVPYKLKKAGTYVFTGRITINDQPQQGHVTFKVRK